MTPVSVCPPVRDLQGLVRGPGASPMAEALYQHLGRCERCREILHTFAADGPPPAGPPALQALVPAAAPPGSSATWQRGLPRPAAPAPPAPAPAPLTKITAETTQALIALLAPAEQADELGRLGPYRVLQVLGTGATGVVFRAEDSSLGRQVALKVMKPVAEDNDRARQRFLREARATAVIDHDHIVTIYQVGEDRGLPYLAMKLLQGETLDDRLKRSPLLMYQVLHIGREIALGLAAAHERGLIHRDIKPANLYLEAGTDRVKIVDFGLARGAADDLHLTRTGTIVGTPAYMSPEQARGGPVDHRSDLYSLGCVLYRLCAGRTPFLADDVLGMLVALSEDQPPPLKAFNPDVPDALVGLVAQLLAKVPEARPASATAVAGRLEAIGAGLAAVLATGPSARQPGRHARRRFLVTVVQMLVLAGLGWAGYQYGPAAVRTLATEVKHALRDGGKKSGPFR